MEVNRFEGRIYKPLPATPTEVALRATSTSGPTVVALVDEPTSTPDPLRVLPSGRINLLVLGTDKRPNDPDHYARSDTLILVNVDTVARTARMLSIPRDLVMHIPGYGTNKVNAAYLFGEYYQEPGGGQALAVRTISQFFGVPVDYYVTVNFQGFKTLVDTVGGVDIDVPYALDDYQYPTDESGDLYGVMHVHFDAGLQHMDGTTALRYARTRHADNDFMRSKRQQQVILAVRKKAMNLDLLPKLPSIIDQLGGMVETNIPPDKQIAFAHLGYDISASDVMTYSIDSTMITATTLADGSEGLKLDWEAAQPTLDSFFGYDVSQNATATAVVKKSSSKGDRGSKPEGQSASDAITPTAAKTLSAGGEERSTPSPVTPAVSPGVSESP